MAWANSKVFGIAVYNSLTKQTNSIDLDGDTFYAALYNNTITPDNTVTTANSSYNAGQWATANEVYQAVQWPQAGVTIGTVSVTAPSAGVSATTTFTVSGGTTSSGSAATLSGVYGCLVYDNTATGKPGLCYNYFGGSQSVTAGTFTIAWNASGIATFAA